MTKVVDTRAALHQVTGIVENIEARIEGIETTSRTRMDTMASNIEATAVSVMGLRALGGQIMGFVRTFPQEIRDLLQTIIQADWRTYQAVLQIQERLSRTPTSWHESNIQFTNALGEYREYVIRSRPSQLRLCSEDMYNLDRSSGTRAELSTQPFVIPIPRLSIHSLNNDADP